MRFTADRFDDVTTSTIGESLKLSQLCLSRQQASPITAAVVSGVDFRVKYLTLNGKRVKLAVW